MYHHNVSNDSHGILKMKHTVQWRGWSTINSRDSSWFNYAKISENMFWTQCEAAYQHYQSDKSVETIFMHKQW